MSLAPGSVLDRVEAAIYDRLYVGRRWGGRDGRSRSGRTSLAVIDRGEERQIELRPGGPSPSGFEWGYRGAGPCETARAILWEHTGREPDRAACVSFMEAFIAPAPLPGFGVAAVEVDAWLVVAEAG